MVNDTKIHTILWIDIEESWPHEIGNFISDKDIKERA